MTNTPLTELLTAIEGVLTPVAGRDWHGKWRVQKAIELARQAR